MQTATQVKADLEVVQIRSTAGLEAGMDLAEKNPIYFRAVCAVQDVESDREKVYVFGLIIAIAALHDEVERLKALARSN